METSTNLSSEDVFGLELRVFSPKMEDAQGEVDEEGGDVRGGNRDGRTGS